MSPATVSMTLEEADKVVVPIPTLPEASTVNTVAPEEDATTIAGTPALAVIPRLPAGVVEPMPSLPFEPKLNITAPVDDAILRILVVVVP